MTVGGPRDRAAYRKEGCCKHEMSTRDLCVFIYTSNVAGSAFIGTNELATLVSIRLMWCIVHKYKLRFQQWRCPKILSWCFSAVFLPIWKSARECVPAVFQKFQLYPGQDSLFIVIFSDTQLACGSQGAVTYQHVLGSPRLFGLIYATSRR